MVEKTTSATFSLDGSRFATTSEDKRVRVWQSADGKLIATLEGLEGAGDHIALSPDGTIAVVATPRSIRIANLATRTDITIRTATSPRIITFSPDGTRFAIGQHDGVASVWDVSTGKRITVLSAHGPATQVAFSADGGRILTASDSNSAVSVWNATTFEEIARLDAPPDARLAQFSGDARLVLTVGRTAAVKVWDIESRRPILDLQQHGILSANISPDGRLLVIVEASYRYSGSTGEIIDAPAKIVLLTHYSQPALAADMASAARASRPSRGAGSWRRGRSAG